MTVTACDEYLEAAIYVKALLTSPPITINNADGNPVDLEVDEHPGVELGVYPRITFSEAAWTDVSVINGVRVWSEVLLLVHAIWRGESTLALRAAAKAIDARLHRSSGLTSEAQILECVRQGGFTAQDVEGGISYRRLGGYYLLTVQPLDP